MQIIHVSYLFIISSVLKQILASLDLSERQFCCFFVFVAVELFFLRTYEHLLPLPSPKYANVRICTTPLPPDCVHTKWMVPNVPKNGLALMVFCFISTLELYESSGSGETVCKPNSEIELKLFYNLNQLTFFFRHKTGK